MVMIPKNDKARKIAKRAMRQKGVAQPKPSKVKKEILDGPYLQH